MLELDLYGNAIAGIVLSAIVCGTIGSYIVVRRLVFVSGSIAHASLGGIGVALLGGWSPLLGASIFAVGSAVGIRGLSGQSEREDSIIAVFWTLGMSVGVVCAFLAPQYGADLPSYLFGNVLLLDNGDLCLLAVMSLLTIVGFACRSKTISLIAFDRDCAFVRGMPVAVVEYIMMAFIGLAVVSVLRIAGIVLAIALLTIPQMTASALRPRSLAKMMVLSVLLCLACSLTGLYLSVLFNLPVGATIVIIAALLYLIVRLLPILTRVGETQKA